MLFPEKGYADGDRLASRDGLASMISMFFFQRRRLIKPKLYRVLQSVRSRKEVIQPQVPLRLPCYDFTPVINLTVVGCVLAVRSPTSGKTNSHGVTGGVYKARERIHRSVLICDY